MLFFSILSSILVISLIIYIFIKKKIKKSYVSPNSFANVLKEFLSMF